MKQPAALCARVVFFHHEPYADFARLASYGRRVQQALCYTGSWFWHPCTPAGPFVCDSWLTCQHVLNFSLLPPRVQQRDPPTGSQEVLVASPQMFDDRHEAFGDLTVAHHDICLVVRADGHARGGRQALPDLQIVKPAGAPLTHTTHHGRRSSARLRATTSFGQHRSGGVTGVLRRTSTSQPRRGSRVPTMAAPDGHACLGICC